MGNSPPSQFSSKTAAADVLAAFPESVRNKNIIVTGANCGIGKEAALQFAKHGANVIIACRDAKKGKEAEEEIRKASGNPNVSTMALDLASFKSVRAFADAFKAQGKPLHILLNNAGVMACPFGKTEDGLEMQLGTNHFGHFLLTGLLIDQLKAGAPSRVVQVSSQGHKWSPSGGIKFDDLNSDKSYDKWTNYGQSKLANVYFARELNRKYSAAGVTAYSLHPGVIQIELMRHQGVLSPIWGTVAGPFLKSIPQGAATSVYCSVAPNIEGGRYYWDSQLGQESELAKNDEISKRLWDVSQKITGLANF